MILFKINEKKVIYVNINSIKRPFSARTYCTPLDWLSLKSRSNISLTCLSWLIR